MEARLREPLPNTAAIRRSCSSPPSRRPRARPAHRSSALLRVRARPGNPVGVLADALAAGFGTFAGAWFASPGAAMIELVVLDWLRDLCGLPATPKGLFVSGGSMANLTALAVALAGARGHERPRATVYLSDEAHSSVERAVRVLGVAPHVRVLPATATSDWYRRAEAAIAADRGRRVAAPPASSPPPAPTGTGAVDPLDELRRSATGRSSGCTSTARTARPPCCRRGRAALRRARAGRLADARPAQVAVPAARGRLPAGARRRRAGRTFSRRPGLPARCHTAGSEVNFADRGLQLTRGFRALKLWMSIKVFGADAFRDAVEHGVALAEHAERMLARDPTWEVVTPARLGIVTSGRSCRVPRLPSSTP